jgi:hypothetical protein
MDGFRVFSRKKPTFSKNPEPWLSVRDFSFRVGSLTSAVLHDRTKELERFGVFRNRGTSRRIENDEVFAYASPSVGLRNRNLRNPLFQREGKVRVFRHTTVEQRRREFFGISNLLRFGVLHEFSNREGKVFDSPYVERVPTKEMKTVVREGIAIFEFFRRFEIVGVEIKPSRCFFGGFLHIEKMNW